MSTDEVNTRTRRASNVVIRPMQAADVDIADEVMRTSFGTFWGLPEPHKAFGDAQYVRPRFATSPRDAFVAELEGQVVGSVFAIRWGSFGFFGPLTVRVDLWDQGIARALMPYVVDRFDEWGLRLSGLHTFAQSAKHVRLYQRFGFWPQHLTAIMTKLVEPTDETPDTCIRFSQLNDSEQALMLAECTSVTDSVYEGLDVTTEISAIEHQRLGDTVILLEGEVVTGLALCHCGAGEAGSASCYIKFAAVRGTQQAPHRFDQILDGVESLARDRGVAAAVLGMSTARREAYEQVVARGYRSGGQGVRMQRPDDVGYCRPGVYVIDDLR